MPFLLIDKPAGITSHDVVDAIRRVTGERRVGHAGTLDPFATGLLIVGVGRESTRDLGKILGLDKSYEAEFILGATTETLDPESPVVRAALVAAPSKDEIESAIKTLTGPILQVPPMYSAIKKAGKKMYELARQGKTLELEPRPVTIKTFELLGGPEADGSIRVHISCSSGTYIRSMARDLAAALGTTGYVRTLRRTAIGPRTVDEATELAKITPETWATLGKKSVDEVLAA